jgi:hypothetical protein
MPTCHSHKDTLASLCNETSIKAKGELMNTYIVIPDQNKDETTDEYSYLEQHGKVGEFKYNLSPEKMTVLEVISGLANFYMNNKTFCVQLDEKYLTMFALKFSDARVIKINQPDEELIDKGRAYFRMAKRLNEMDRALSTVQSAEGDLGSYLEEITDSYDSFNDFEELSCERYYNLYTMRNPDVKEVFASIFEP